MAPMPILSRIAAAALALALAGDAPAVRAQAPAPAAVPATVPVALPLVQSVAETTELTGNAAAVSKVALTARVTGFLEKIHFEDGQLVKKGDLLFTIQQDQYKAQLQQAQAQLQLYRAALAHATVEVKRYTQLVKRNAATQVEVDNWVFQQASAEANILGAQAQVAIQQLNLDYTEVRAPFDGQMGRHLVDAGNVVGGAVSNLGEILQLDPIYVEINLSSQQAQQIRANLDQRRLTLAQLQQVPIEVGISGESGFPLRGTLNYVAPAIDAATGTLFVRGILRNQNATLLPGAFVRVRLPMGRTLQSSMVVPDRVLQEDQGGRYLLVVDKDDVVRQRYVQLGPVTNGMRVITGGLQRDERVVVGDLWRASPGTKITPQLTPIGN
jgi:RND family efflux transporter MFP subunit